MCRFFTMKFLLYELCDSMCINTTDFVILLRRCVVDTLQSFIVYEISVKKKEMFIKSLVIFLCITLLVIAWKHDGGILHTIFHVIVACTYVLIVTFSQCTGPQKTNFFFYYYLVGLVYIRSFNERVNRNFYLKFV